MFRIVFLLTISNYLLNKMIHTKKIFFLLFFITYSLLSQEKKTISGTIYDESNNETLIGVSLYFPELNSGTTTNEYGFYSITLPKGTYKLQVSYLGYSSILASITLNEKTTKNFKLIEETESLEEIVIESNIEKLNVRTPQMSINKLTSATIKNIPVVIIQGLYDLVTPFFTAQKLNNALPHSKMYSTMAGHSAFDRENIKYLVKTTDEFANK